MGEINVKVGRLIRGLVRDLRSQADEIEIILEDNGLLSDIEDMADQLKDQVQEFIVAFEEIKNEQA